MVGGIIHKVVSMFKSIHYKNLQSIADFKIDNLPKTGIISFIGDNNNGKSVLTKVLNHALKNELKDKSVRKGLLRYIKHAHGRSYETYGELRLESYLGRTLTIHIELEVKTSYIRLIDENGDEYERTVSDPACIYLLRQFGLHIDEKHNFSLNVYKTYDPLIGVNTAPSMTKAVLKEALVDPFVESGIEGLSVVYSDLSARIKDLEAVAQLLATQSGSLRFYDIEKENAHCAKLKEVEEILLGIGEAPLVLPEIVFPILFPKPDLQIVFLRSTVKGLTEVKFRKKPKYGKAFVARAIALTPPALPDISEKLQSLLTAKNNWETFKSKVCPACGRDFSD